MKKSLLLILACFFAVFMLAGCDDSSDDNTPPAPTTDPLPDIQSLKGTYNIDFFYTDGGGAAVVTTDCDNVTKYVGSDAKKCTDATKENVKYKGEMTLDIDGDGNVIIISKIQMSGGAFENVPLGKTAKSQGANYQYTVYTSIPADAISEYIINDPATGKSVKGTTGRNAKSPTSSSALNSTYKFTWDNTTKTLINNIEDKSTGIVTANVVIRLKKEKETVDTLDGNTKYPDPDIDNFEDLTANYHSLLGLYKIASLTLGDENTGINESDFARINEDNNNLLLHLNVNALESTIGDIYVYSEDAETLMKNGLTETDKKGITNVNFKLGDIANIDMTRNYSYSKEQGVGEKQENISVLINDNKNIAKNTSDFNIDVTHIGGGNKFYSFSFIPDVTSADMDLGLPTGSYVGLSNSTIDEITFTSTPSECSTDGTKTTCSVKVEIDSNSDFDDVTIVPMIVLVNEVDSNGANPTGVSTLGLLKLDVQ